MELSRWLRASQKGSTERVFPPMSSTSVRWNDLYSFNSLCSDGIQVRTGFVSLGQQQISDRRDLRNLVGGGFQWKHNSLSILNQSKQVYLVEDYLILKIFLNSFLLTNISTRFYCVDKFWDRQFKQFAFHFTSRFSSFDVINLFCKVIFTVLSTYRFVMHWQPSGTFVNTSIDLMHVEMLHSPGFSHLVLSDWWKLSQGFTRFSTACSSQTGFPSFVIILYINFFWSNTLPPSRQTLVSLDGGQPEIQAKGRHD